MRQIIAPMASNFITNTKCEGNRAVFTVRGKLLLVLEIGDLYLHHIRVIKNVLHVPLLKAHLLSPQKLVKDVKCCFIIDHEGYFLFTKVMGQKIATSPTSTSRITGGIDVSAQKKLWTFYYRFGHLSFSILKGLFLVLFKGMDVEYFARDACQFAKHKRTCFVESVVYGVLLQDQEYQVPGGL